MKACVTYPTYVHDLIEGVSKNVHYLRESLNEAGVDAKDASPRVDVGQMNSKSVYLRQGLTAMRRLMQEMEDPETDVIHYHVSIPAMSMWAAIAKMRARRKVPMVLHMWNPWFDPRDAYITGGVDRFYHRMFNGPLMSMPFLPSYDELVVSSDYQKRQLIARGVEQNVHVIPNGVDLGHYQPRPTDETRRNARRELGLPVDKTLALYYGHLTPWKGVHVLVEALPKALEEHPDATLVIAHTDYGRNASVLRARLRELGMLDRVHFLGVCDVPLLLQAIDIGIVPATAAVGTACHPNVVLEYMSAGVPLVTSRVGSIPEAVVDGKTGLLAEPGNAQDLAQKLDRLLGDETLRRRMSIAARERAEKEYDWNVIGRRYERVLRAAV